MDHRTLFRHPYLLMMSRRKVTAGHRMFDQRRTGGTSYAPNHNLTNAVFQ